MATVDSSRLSQCNHMDIHTVGDKIRGTMLPTGRMIQLSRRFFPTTALKEILTPDEVRKILNHHTGSPGCPECRGHLRNRPEVQPSDKDAARIVGTDSSLNLFALLVYLRYPLLVGCFLSEYEDGKVPSPRFFTEYDLADRLFSHLPPGRQLETLVEDFEDNKWRFSVPKFDNEGTFQKYHDRIIMPYLKEEWINEGAYGKVYKVEVHRGYCSRKFLGASHANNSSGINSDSVKLLDSGSSRLGSITFARKEYKNSGVIAFLKERTNLELIDQLRHPHLIHIKHTYQLGKKFNILFPYATSNLQDYLRKGFAPRTRQISQNPLWEQVLGITEALSKLINFENPIDGPGNKLLKIYHLDLKPQNVLVFVERSPGMPRRDVLRISDFGQSEFEDVSPGNSTDVSRLIEPCGTDAYAPPEYDGDGASSVYDVWSLAIIVLEILAFAMRGIDGLTDARTGLDNVRRTRGSSYDNSRFYLVTNQAAILKPEISQWLDGLVQDQDLQESEREQFVRPIVKLSRQMLEPQWRNRKTIDKVLAKMREIFKKRISERIEETAMALKTADETILVDLKSIQFFPGGLSRHSEPSSFFILESDGGSLRIFAGNNIRHARHQRQELSVVPLFQGKETDEVGVNHFAFEFGSVKEDFRHSLSDACIVVDDENHARSLQAALINHEVSKRYRVTHLSMKTPVPLKEFLHEKKLKLKQALFPRKSGGDPDPTRDTQGEIVPLWIELWIEKRDNELDLDQLTVSHGLKKDLPRLDRESAREKSIPLGRVVIYCKDRTIIMPFTREGAIKERDDDDTSYTLTFEPMDIKQCEVFEASSLKRKSYGETIQPAAIPMSLDVLCDSESRNKFSCKSLGVEFACDKDARNFYKLFRRQKARWQSLIKGDQTKISRFVTP